jgi:uncharacterized membrane protein (TIGR02234 family)
MTDPRRRTFGPVVLLGLASAGLAAVAGNRAWAEGHGQAADRLAGMPLADEAGKVPAAGALALVGLACWGVVLVTRGRVRRGVAVLGGLAAVGILVTVVTGWSSSVHSLRHDLSEVGPAGTVDHTAWIWLAAAGALGSLVATALAVRWAPGWPEMGSRYDAPTGSSTDAPAGEQPPADPAEQSSLDLWKAMDEGRDPTAGPPE